MKLKNEKVSFLSKENREFGEAAKKHSHVVEELKIDNKALN